MNTLERSLFSTTMRAQESRARPTPPPAGRQFRDAMVQVTARVLGGVGTAASLASGGGGGLVGLASRGVSGRLASSLPGGGMEAQGGGGLGGVLGGGQGGQSEALELLTLQRDIGLEQQRYSALSNVLKARHETARAVIQNVR